VQHFEVAAGQELKKQVPSNGPLIIKPQPSLNSESEKIMEVLTEILKQQQQETQADLKARMDALKSTPIELKLLHYVRNRAT
jgi:hypothetical protein